jgi:hypothetical protein
MSSVTRPSPCGMPITHPRRDTSCMCLGTSVRLILVGTQAQALPSCLEMNVARSAEVVGSTTHGIPSMSSAEGRLACSLSLDGQPVGTPRPRGVDQAALRLLFFISDLFSGGRSSLILAIMVSKEGSPETARVLTSFRNAHQRGMWGHWPKHTSPHPPEDQKTAQLSGLLLWGENMPHMTRNWLMSHNMVEP